MRAPRWICNLAGAESSLSHSLPDTMGAQVDYDDDCEMHLDEMAEDSGQAETGNTPKQAH
jgi:hypothetical protein